MSRNKGIAPLPPRKPGFKSSGVASTTQNPSADSLVLLFDELTRNGRVLQDGAEDQFLQFAGNQSHCRKRWEHAEIEVNRVTLELQKCEAEVRKLEMKLGQARDLLAAETTLRKKAEQERDQLGQKWDIVREMISHPGETMNDETRSRLQKLEATINSRRGTAVFSPGVALGLSPVNEMDSTGSILSVSDLSYDTQGSMLVGSLGDESKLRSGRSYKRKSSGGGAAAAAARHEKRSKGSQGGKKSLELLAVRRSAGVERYNERNIDDYIPSAPPLEDAVSAWQAGMGRFGCVQPGALTPSQPSSSSVVTLTPSHASTATLAPMTPCGSGGSGTPGNPGTGTGVRRNNSNRGMNRPHQFVQKNNFKTETCGPCQRRIKFGKICYKCRECRAVAHPECRDQAPLPCVPSGSASKTPSRPGQGYLRGSTLADYTPHTSPMVPAIIVHCVNQVEARGLQEVGIYRIPGSEREVKDVRDKFLAGRGCPNLAQVDVHVLCGVIKDFLRNLREPLVPSSMWTIFTSAATNPDCTDAESNIYQAVSELPQPNRDTMAFIMLHLQKVAAAKETKMTRSNLAKILGPTIIGYSSMDAQPAEIMNEVGVQAATMEKLIGIDSDYWSTFLNQEEGENLFKDNILSPATPEIMQMQASIFRTPGGDPGLTPRVGRAMPLAPRTRDRSEARIFASPVMH